MERLIDRFLEAMTTGVGMSARLMWWVLPAVEIFEKVKNAIHDVLSGENINNTDEQSL